MTNDLKDWLRDHAGKVMVTGTGGLLVFALLVLGSSLLGSGSDAAQARTRTQSTQLEHKLATAQRDLAIRHEKLLAQLPGVDFRRAGRDFGTGRSVLLSITGSSASTRTVRQTQALLDARYDFLTPSSRTHTEFVPEWMSMAGATDGTGTIYALGELQIDVSAVAGLDYSYVGLARLDPVPASKATPGKSEYVLFTYSTREDGTVTSFEIYRASNRTRDAFLTADLPDESSTPTDAVSTDAPTGSPSPGG